MMPAGDCGGRGRGEGGGGGEGEGRGGGRCAQPTFSMHDHLICPDRLVPST